MVMQHLPTCLAAAPRRRLPQEISHLSKRWRAERNLWMCAFAFSAWVFLTALYRETARRMDAESRLADMERSGGLKSAAVPLQTKHH
jgi:hypothetical protein